MKLFDTIISLMRAGGVPISHVLTGLSPAFVNSGNNPFGVSISPDNLSLYSANFGGTISQYSRNNITGLLSAYTPATVSSGFGYSSTISPDGTSLYAGCFNGLVYQFGRNITTGLLTAYSPTNVVAGGGASNSIWALVVSSDGKHLYASHQQLGRIYQFNRNVTTGLLTALSPAFISSGTNAKGLSISSDGNYVYNSADSAIFQYSRNSTTGLLSPLSPASVPTGPNIQNLNCISADGNFFYSCCNNDKYIYEYSRDSGTGLLSSIGSISLPVTDPGPFGIFVSPDGEAAFVVAGVSIYQFSRNTITGLLIESNPFKIINPDFIGTSPGSICGSIDSKFVYVPGDGPSTERIYQYSRS